MRLVDKVCQELGVAIGEEWDSTDGNKYCILSDGTMTINGSIGGYRYWEDIFRGLIKPVWKPKEGEHVFMIDFAYDDNVVEYIWDNNEQLINLYNKGQVFKTYLEAERAAKSMLHQNQHIKEECGNACTYCGKDNNPYLGEVMLIQNKVDDGYNRNNVACEVSLYDKDLDIYVYDTDSDMVSSELFGGRLNITYCPFCGRHL